MRQETTGVVALLAVFATLLCGCAVPGRQLPVAGPVTAHDPDVRSETGPAARPVSGTTVLEPATLQDLAGIIPRLADRRVVFVGEQHDQFAHHLAQLEIIRRLHALHPHMAIGMEAFQQPFQSVLDDYIAGRIDEREMLRNSEYFSRWRMDYNLYAPILRYARQQHLPVVALNLPSELTSKVGREGMDALSDAERSQLPAVVDRSDRDYERRLKDIFSQHPHGGHGFERFLDVQLLWDEGMAQRAADWLRAHPDDDMVVLAGSGHLAWGSGIPRRLARRLPVDSAVVLNGQAHELKPGVADYILLTEPQQAPRSGRLGVLLDDHSAAPTVEKCMSDSPCSRAGLQRGDRLLSIDGIPVHDLADLRLALWDRHPGDSVTLRISRKSWFAGTRELDYEVRLR